MDFTGFIVGVVAGVGGMFAKEKLVGGKSKSNNQQDELKNLYDENEKLRSRNKEAERRIEDLMAENQKIKKASKNQSDNADEIEDELDSLRSKLRRAQATIDELQRKNNELQKAVESYEMENK